MSRVKQDTVYQGLEVNHFKFKKKYTKVFQPLSITWIQTVTVTGTQLGLMSKHESRAQMVQHAQPSDRHQPYIT